MKYLICQEWINTANNHAGMKHMCLLLKKYYPQNYKVIVKAPPREWPKKKNPFEYLINYFSRLWYQIYIFPKEYIDLCEKTNLNLKPGDEVFLLEYMLPFASQYKLALHIKKRYPEIKLYALSHLSPTFYKNPLRYPIIIKTWSHPIDKFLTLGFSLSSYFSKYGIPQEKISTGFHYVDKEFYSPTNPVKSVSSPMRIITMGGMQRNYSMLAKIVERTPNVHWIICKGREQIDYLFENLHNVELKGYLSEEDLRKEMEKSDISVNVMQDTVGSNVITTSMAMGLAMIVSDVGSIRQYCSEENSLFCENNIDSFVKAIQLLANNPQKVLNMKIASLKRVNSFSIDEVHNWFNSLK